MKIIRIDECMDCPHAEYYKSLLTPEGNLHDAMLCGEKYKVIPANGIPDWCTLESDTVTTRGF